MKKTLGKKTRRTAQAHRRFESGRDWQDLQFAYDRLNVDWARLAAQVDVLGEANSSWTR